MQSVATPFPQQVAGSLDLHNAEIEYDRRKDNSDHIKNKEYNILFLNEVD